MLEGTQLTQSDGDYRKISVAIAVVTAVCFVALAAVLSTLPGRGLGFLEPIPGHLSLVFTIAGGITQLGDPWFLLLMASLVYLLGTDREFIEQPRDGAFVLAVTLAAFSFTDVLKNVFRAPRPPSADVATAPSWLPTAFGGAFESITTASGFAFPSGHALGTAAVFAALASRLSVGSATARWTAAAVGVLLVASSRVVLGVHYGVDIVGGFLAGVCLFAVAETIDDGEPLRVFLLGIGIGVLAVILSALAPAGEVWNAGQWLGGSIGAAAAWYAVRPSRRLGLLGTLAAGIPAAVLWVSIYVTSPPLLVTVVGTAVAASVTILAPTITDRITDQT